jgi:hypothetical protein
MLSYITNNDHDIKIGSKIILSNSQILQSINFANEALRSLDSETRKFDIYIFEALGMINLS